MATVGRTPVRAREAPARSAATTLVPDADIISVYAEITPPGIVCDPAACHSDVTTVDNDRYHITHVPSGCRVEFAGEGTKHIGIVVGVVDVVRATRWRRGDRREKPKGDASTLVITVKVKMQMIRGRMYGTTKLSASGGDSTPEAHITSVPVDNHIEGEKINCIVMDIAAEFPTPPESRIIVIVKVITKSIAWADARVFVYPELPWAARVIPWYNQTVAEDIVVPMEED